VNRGDNPDGDHAIREKIASQLRSIGKGPKEQITAEELQNLKTAASRLDQILKAAAAADQQALKTRRHGWISYCQTSAQATT
jgi:hypothetical protein